MGVLSDRLPLFERARPEVDRLANRECRPGLATGAIVGHPPAADFQQVPCLKGRHVSRSRETPATYKCRPASNLLISISTSNGLLR